VQRHIIDADRVKLIPIRSPELRSLMSELATADSVQFVIGSNSAMSVRCCTPAVVVNNGSAADGPVIHRRTVSCYGAGDKSEADLHEYLWIPRDLARASQDKPRGPPSRLAP